MMKIEIWSDVVCPFCYIGKRKLEMALDKFPHKEEVKIEFKNYQLDPNTPPYTGQDFYESMAVKFGSVEQSKQMMVGITQQAKAVGLDFHFDTMKPANTFDAHRLTKFAKTLGKDAAISERLFYANFTESKDIGNIETLTSIAVEVGLNKKETLKVLQDKKAYAKEVKHDIEEAKQLGVTSVPTFIINGKYALSGAQETETFTQALNQVWEEENTITPLEKLSPNSESDAACGPEGCDVPKQ